MVIQNIKLFAVMATVLLSLASCGDDDGGSAPEEMPANLNPVDPAPVDITPVAQADSITTDENSAATIDLAANDTGLDDTPVTYSLESAPSNGTAEISANGITIYTPSTDFDGSDSFVYLLTDNDGDSSTATVSISVINTDVGNDNIWPAVDSVVNTDVENAISIILDNMTLAEKVGQMVQAEIGEASPEEAGNFNLGSVLNGGGSWPNGKQSATG